jgi:hypothetical protein
MSPRDDIAVLPVAIEARRGMRAYQSGVYEVEPGTFQWYGQGEDGRWHPHGMRFTVGAAPMSTPAPEPTLVERLRVWWAVCDVESPVPDAVVIPKAHLRTIDGERWEAAERIENLERENLRLAGLVTMYRTTIEELARDD